MSCRRLVLDAHGVVLNNPLPAFLDEMAIATGQTPMDLKRRWHARGREDAWLGRVPDEVLWRELTLDRGAPATWRRRLERRYEPGPAAAHLKRWRRRIPLWVLSNHRTHWLRPRLERLELDALFDSILVSDRVGAMKPQAAAFDAAVAGLRYRQDALLLDDQWRNVEAARRFGLRAVHVQPGTVGWVDEVDAWLEDGVLDSPAA